MNTYNVFYFRDSDHPKKISAENAIEAAYIFFCEQPENKDIVVHKGVLASKIINPKQITEKYPDILDRLGEDFFVEKVVDKKADSESEGKSYGKLRSVYDKFISLPEELNLESKYGALRFISRLYLILSYLSVAAGSITFLIGLIKLFGLNRYSSSVEEMIVKTMIFGGIVLAAVGFITFLALSEGIKLFIDIEENTRTSNKLFSQLLESFNKGRVDNQD